MMAEWLERVSHGNAMHSPDMEIMGSKLSGSIYFFILFNEFKCYVYHCFQAAQEL